MPLRAGTSRQQSRWFRDGKPWFDSWHRQVFINTSTSVLRPTQPPVGHTLNLFLGHEATDIWIWPLTPVYVRGSFTAVTLHEDLGGVAPARQAFIKTRGESPTLPSLALFAKAKGQIVTNQLDLLHDVYISWLLFYFRSMRFIVCETDNRPRPKCIQKFCLEISLEGNHLGEPLVHGRIIWIIS